MKSTRETKLPKPVTTTAEIPPVYRAYHEAGHAIIACAVGWKVGRVSIAINAKAHRGGRAQLLKPPPRYRWCVPTGEPDGSVRLNTRGKRLAEMALHRKYATIIYASLAAVQRFSKPDAAPFDIESGSPALVGFGGDWRMLQDLSAAAFGRFKPQWLRLRYLGASDLVCAHWDEIEALASALVDRETLSGGEVMRIFKRCGR